MRIEERPNWGFDQHIDAAGGFAELVPSFAAAGLPAPQSRTFAMMRAIIFSPSNSEGGRQSQTPTRIRGR